jgi:hypothetical protein
MGEGDRPKGGGGGVGFGHRDRHSHHSVRRLVELARQLARGYSDDRYALRFEPALSTQIALGPIAHVVRDSINFDSEARLRAIEIEHIKPHRVLTAKGRQARDSGAQAAPKASFGRRKLAPELARAGDGPRRRSHYDIPGE